jgi:salicylate hydroxylase
VVSEHLQIAIVGGGIGDLAAALALRARGLSVTVFEQADELREIGAGVTIFSMQRFCFSESVLRMRSRK